MTRRYDAKKFSMAHLRATAEKCKSWGRWGPDDEICTLNHVKPQDVIYDGKLINTELLVTVIEKNFQLRWATAAERAQVLESVFGVSRW
jgi:hypothetical protein